MNNVLMQNSKLNTTDYKPVFFDINIEPDAKEIQRLAKDETVTVYNSIQSQIAELVKIKYSGERLSPGQMQEKVAELLNGIDADAYGVWVYYPWSKKLVHILNEDDFIAVRTNRNMYKITPDEIVQLRKKKIAIIGLSVGQTIAQTIATERICGELRLADFDTLELGNLNRLQAGLYELGLSKVIIAARKIAEIDPYINIKCWSEGINADNIDDFLTGDGNVDILVEECDSIDIKVLSRIKARQHKVPVLMETNDTGMLDVERFDIEPERKLFHGRTPDFENPDTTDLLTKLKNLTTEQKILYLSEIIGMENVSEEMKISLSYMNKTITSWPQLASAVSLGAAIVCDTCRRILLNKFTQSGRHFIDFKKLIH